MRLQDVHCLDRWSIKGVAIWLDDEKQEEKQTEGTMTPSPPRRAGSERSSLSVGPNAD